MFSHLFGSLHGITGGVSDLWGWLGVDLIVELKDKKHKDNELDSETVTRNEFSLRSTRPTTRLLHICYIRQSCSWLQHSHSNFLMLHQYRFIEHIWKCGNVYMLPLYFHGWDKKPQQRATTTTKIPALPFLAICATVAHLLDRTAWATF